jgi:UDP-N-acetylmuramoyl-L-alanyl-D-glutamate--2,6-diaminopimelate ligase
VLLSDIFQSVSLLSVSGNLQADISNLTADSRQVIPQSLFVAMTGTQTDGHTFIETAIEKGAIAIVCEHFPDNTLPGVTYIQVMDSAKAYGVMAGNFFDNPSRKLQFTAVTGTNGKTTTVTLLFRLFRALGYNTALLSTVQNQINDEVFTATHTTPEPVALNRFLAEAVQKGCQFAFMEASSHAIVQERIAGLHFAGAVFTNISHDHLDFHKTFDNYIRAKKKLFDDLPASAFALVNRDDKRGRVMLQNTQASSKTFSMQTMADFRGKILSDTLQGLEMEVEGQQVWFQLVGKFNAYNLLGIYGTAVLLGEKPEEVLLQLSGLQAAPGRFEQMVSKNKITAIVDYAHTPDALENVLQTLTELRENHRIITVVGCGGNRDAAKRPVMGKIAAQYSDQVFLTSDNPRNESPAEILAQMLAGVEIVSRRKVQVLEDRREAIRQAIAAALPGDVVLVAGKGHENYQEIQGVKYPFDDREVVREIFSLPTSERV